VRALDSHDCWYTLLAAQPALHDYIAANLTKDLESLKALLDEARPFAGLCRALVAPILEPAPSR
jgi:hypothetical protein